MLVCNCCRIASRLSKPGVLLRYKVSQHGNLLLSVKNETLVERGQAPTFNVGVLLELRYKTLVGGFRTPSWSLAELFIRGEGVAGVREKTVVDDAEDCKRYLWTGFELNFYRDGGESYWHTLVGEQQEVFVVCQEDEEDGIAPILVTADYDEAMAYHEADDTVLAAPMPQVIYQALERFVLENYAPQQKKRRKRKQWHDTENKDEPFAKKPQNLESKISE